MKLSFLDGSKRIIGSVAMVVLDGWLAAAGVAHAQPLPPSVATFPASDVGATNATLNGAANPSGISTFGYFQWGTTTNYGNVTPAQSLGSGSSNTNFSQAMGGLLNGITYHYRAVASNSFHVVSGSNQPLALYRCIDFNDGQLPSGSVLLGSASPTGGGIRLTPALNSQVGAWMLDDLNRGAKVTGFEARSLLRLTGGSALHADGFSFVWARDLPNIAFGEEKNGGVAINNVDTVVVSNGLVVSLDTFSNGENDPAPAVDVVYNGMVLARQTNATLAGLLNSATAALSIFIRLDENGRLNVEFTGGSPFPVTFAVIANLPLPGFSGLAGARFGWGARTGGAADDQFVDDVCLSTTVPCPTPVLSITRTNAMDVLIAFTGTLQSAPTPSGGWTNILGAANPYATGATGQNYYRAVAPCDRSP